MTRAELSVRLARHGYEAIGQYCRRRDADAAEALLLGKPVICLTGSEAARQFYDSRFFTRSGVAPGPVQATLFGRGGVHGLEGAAHLARKALFTSAVTRSAVEELAGLAEQEWQRELRPRHGGLRLFDLAALVYTRAVCRWVRAPMPKAGDAALARSLTAMVDGFATLGPRHWRARAARGRTQLWAARVIDGFRDGSLRAEAGSVARQVAEHRDENGNLLPVPVAAVELLNIVRPTVAVAWFTVFAAHALHTEPRWRGQLREDETLARPFAEEVRRCYPFAPFLGARVRNNFTWRGQDFAEGRLALLDVYGTNRDPRLWPDPEVFDPRRFTGHQPGPFDMIPQGGGDSHTGHRCPGEPVTVRLLAQAAHLLSTVDYRVPPQELAIPLNRVPTLPAGGFVISEVRSARRETVR